ncbi:MAG: hypothetical protein DLM61_08905 [Pseudonocardiales bacterium]|nr:MAG: hypothetical protein DLM61_08905 [Pseudonocardiales bacterium]
MKTFGSTRALDGIDLQIPQGTVLGLLGPNGAGKTTAVRILSTLLRPDAGRAQVAGVDVLTDPHGVRGKIGLAGQYAAVDANLTGFENLYMIGRLYGMSRRQARSRARVLITRCRLDEAAERTAKTYSGGMRRRLDLAGALVANPEVVMLDEPTTGLDPRGRLDTWEVIAELVADGADVLLTTQYLEEADHLADTIAVIDRGRVIARGTSNELKAQCHTVEVAQSAGLIWLFPLTFVSSAFVPTGNMPAVLKVAAEWNPVTAAADASRELFANTVPATFPPPGGWPGEHSVLYAVLSSVAIIAVFAPLTVVRYRRVARR